MEGTAKGVEAVIGKGNQQCIFVHLFERSSEQGITPAVQVAYTLRQLGCEIRIKIRMLTIDETPEHLLIGCSICSGVSSIEIRIKIRMLTIDETPEHMLQPIRSVKQDKEESLAEPLKLMHHHVFAFLEDEFTLRAVGILIKTPVV